MIDKSSAVAKKPKFLIDTMMGRLAQWLRILGFDANLVEVSQRKRMLEASFLERRVLVTREAKLERAHAYRLIFLREQHWWDQLAKIWETLQLESVDPDDIFSRCTDCNRPIIKAVKSRLDPAKIPPRVWEKENEFWRCPKCRKIFWAGSHKELTLKRLKKIGIPIKRNEVL